MSIPFLGLSLENQEMEGSIAVVLSVEPHFTEAKNNEIRFCAREAFDPEL